MRIHCGSPRLLRAQEWRLRSGTSTRCGETRPTRDPSHPLRFRCVELMPPTSPHRDFISRHHWLATIHNQEYLVERPLDTFCPPLWKKELSRVPLGSHLDLLAGAPIPTVAEEDEGHDEASVASFFATAAALTMPRAVRAETAAGGVGDASYVVPLHPELKVNTKEKKVYEVERLASVVVAAARRHRCEAAVDCGAGSGRLARCLSMQHGLRVTGVECSELHTTAAERSAMLLVERDRYRRREKGAKRPSRRQQAAVERGGAEEGAREEGQGGEPNSDPDFNSNVNPNPNCDRRRRRPTGG